MLAYTSRSTESPSHTTSLTVRRRLFSTVARLSRKVSILVVGDCCCYSLRDAHCLFFAETEVIAGVSGKAGYHSYYKKSFICSISFNVLDTSKGTMRVAGVGSLYRYSFRDTLLIELYCVILPHSLSVMGTAVTSASLSISAVPSLLPGSRRMSPRNVGHRISFASLANALTNFSVGLSGLSVIKSSLWQ